MALLEYCYLGCSDSFLAGCIFDSCLSFSTGTPPWSSNSSHMPSWGLLCLRLWVSFVLWWRSSSSSPCKPVNVPTAPITYPFFPCLFPSLLPFSSPSSIRRKVSRAGTRNELVCHSNQQKIKGEKKKKLHVRVKPPIPHFYALARFVFQKYYVRPHFGWNNLSKINGWDNWSLQRVLLHCLLSLVLALGYLARLYPKWINILQHKWYSHWPTQEWLQGSVLIKCCSYNSSHNELPVLLL